MKKCCGCEIECEVVDEPIDDILECPFDRGYVWVDVRLGHSWLRSRMDKVKP